jgi:hypothetical protein
MATVTLQDARSHWAEVRADSEAAGWNDHYWGPVVADTHTG